MSPSTSTSPSPSPSWTIQDCELWIENRDHADASFRLMDGAVLTVASVNTGTTGAIDERAYTSIHYSFFLLHRPFYLGYIYFL